jgi:molecular chaperone GrpE
MDATKSEESKGQEEQNEGRPKMKKVTGCPRCAESGKKYEEAKDLLQRMQAEFDNFRKRADRDKAMCRSLATADLVKQLLPVLDSFDHALSASEDSGLRLLYAQLTAVMRQAGLTRMEVLGKKFDPHEHEVLMQEKSDKEEGTILEELQPGYRLNGVIIRYAKVKTSAPVSAFEQENP